MEITRDSFFDDFVDVGGYREGNDYPVYVTSKLSTKTAAKLAAAKAPTSVKQFRRGTKREDKYPELKDMTDFINWKEQCLALVHSQGLGDIF